MAGGFIGSNNQKQLPGKMTAYVIYACIIAASGGAIFGYDLGISGGVTAMDSFLRKFFPSVYHRMKDEGGTTYKYCTFNSQILQLFTSSLYLAALVSSLVASTMTRKFGRRLSMLLGGAIFFCGAAINGAAMNIAMLIIGRILLGFGVGLANQSVPLYVSEMAPSQYRGFLNQFFQLMITIGILSANLVNYGTAKIKGGWGWRLGLGLAAVPGAIITLGAFTLPDTPNSLLERHPNNPEKAEEMLRRIRGIKNVEEEYSDLVTASNASQLVVHPWRNLRLRKYRPQLVMSVLIPFFQQITGINVIMLYAPVLFKTIGFGSNAALMSAVITGVVNVLATFIAIFSVDRIGRRALFLEGGTQMIICQLGVGILIGLKFGTSRVAEISEAYAKWVVAFVCVFVAGFSWSWGPLGWLVPSEIFPLEIRSACQSINVAINMIFTFLIAQTYLTMLCHMKFGLFFFFAGWVVVMTIFVFFFLPETKGIPIEEMVVVWRKHWFWKRFIPDEDIPRGLEMRKTGNV